MIKEGLDKLAVVLLDMDGVLWRGTQPILELPALFRTIADLKLQVFCLTNNSTRSVDSYLDQLGNYGVQLKPDQILTSAEAAASYLADIFPRGGPVYAVGEEGLIEALSRRGFSPPGTADGKEVLAVVAGLDRQLTYQKIRQAAHLIHNGALFIGTNPDRTIPTPEGIDPGAGAVISAIEAASGRAALVLGKPERWLYLMALNRAGCKPQEALMIGDRLETDILGAGKIGLRTALVLSGISTHQEAESYHPGPDIIAKDALEVIEGLAL